MAVGASCAGCIESGDDLNPVVVVLPSGARPGWAKVEV
ncbi:hypothetical protein ANO14919_044080 [Xylariales sp. No.14919]|nr:hypothetical protein ANO14919_044080 [Xylariales sp. No.14919]